MTRTLTLLLACCALIGVAGCGDDDESPTTTPAATTQEETTATTEPSGGGEAVEIKIDNFAYSPADATVKVGQTVKWSQEDSAPHDVDSQSGEEVKSPVMQNGGEFEFTPKEAGKIEYICSIHPNMKASLTVTQ